MQQSYLLNTSSIHLACLSANNSGDNFSRTTLLMVMVHPHLASSPQLQGSLPMQPESKRPPVADFCELREESSRLHRESPGMRATLKIPIKSLIDPLCQLPLSNRLMHREADTFNLPLVVHLPSQHGRAVVPGPTAATFGITGITPYAYSCKRIAEKGGSCKMHLHVARLRPIASGSPNQYLSKPPPSVASRCDASSSAPR